MGVKFLILFIISFPVFCQDFIDNDNEDNYSSIIVDSSQFTQHKVSFIDNFFSLKRKYNITKKDLIKLNPQLKNGLLVGSTILVPNFNTRDYIRHTNNIQSRYNIDLLLPFCLFENKSILELNIDSIPFSYLDTINFYSKTRISIDFLSGFILSLDSVNIDTSLLNIRVHDIGNFDYNLNYNYVLDSLIYNQKLIDSDLIIGPLYTDNFNFLTSQLPNNIPIVSPFSTKNSIISGHVNAIQSSISIEDKIVFLSKYIENYHSLDHNIIISRDTIFDLHMTQNNEQEIDTLITPDFHYHQVFLNNIDSSNFKSIESINVKSNVVDSIYHKLDTLDALNVVIVLSQDNIFVSDLIAKLHATRNLHLSVYTLPAIENFDHIPLSELIDLFVAFPNNKSFLKEIDLQIFLKKFHNKFNYHPIYNYASEGYKLGSYFINFLSKKPILPIRQSFETKIIDSYYLFQKDSLNMGYKNKAISIFRYSDFFKL